MGRTLMLFRKASNAMHYCGRFLATSEQPRRGFCAGMGLFSLFFLIASAKAATIQVPSDQPTIQAGINAANNGDTVLVAPGTYYENIDFTGKAVTVTSSGGASTTIIDGSGGAALGLAAVSFKSGEQRNSVLSGFTIQNYSAQYGGNDAGGVYVYGASPTIMNNIITNNACYGISVASGAALIQGNTISNTLLPNEYCPRDGTGLALSGTGTAGGSIVTGNTIENNQQGASEGAGIEIGFSEGNIIENNIIRNNLSGVGAVNVVETYSLIFVQNLVYGNQVGGYLLSNPEVAAGLNVHIPYGGPSSPSSYGIIANNSFFDDLIVYDLAPLDDVTSEVMGWTRLVRASW